MAVLDIIEDKCFFKREGGGVMYLEALWFK